MIIDGRRPQADLHASDWEVDLVWTRYSPETNVAQNASLYESTSA